jgi:uncharacterized membrane protein
MALAANRFLLAFAALNCALATPAAAQSTTIERQVKAAPGKDVRVGVYTDIRPDCTAGPLPAIRLVTPPAHGTVNVKRGTLKATNLKQCLATEVPAFVVLYRAAENYDGADGFLLEIGIPGGRKQLQQFRVTVSHAPGTGQGI